MKKSDAAGRGDLMAAECPSRDVLRRLTGRWGMLVLRVLAEGPHRFSALRKRIGGISERMLAQTLQGLEADGMVLRRDFQTVPPHVEYALTPLGHEAALRVGALLGWIEDALPQIARGWTRA
ncbi:winged helix-turn-helix transcriptional regulator [Paracoccus denitrificans]|uniref:winged helix-turn-helix transcriptional regulator n=1 Tax=Paracoccus denitrificans TaxID=266 RepID=UPI000CEBFE5B|nr:helix-turn-helix domain-containing protein [Paracoccus denitrificans]UFS66761.1 helix-turn-helix transcriptional regulator [Paracoccus denitrificans]